MSRSAVLSRYVIARRLGSGLELLRIRSSSEEEIFLPVFSSREAAKGFLAFNRPSLEWYVRESSPGELVSMLLGPYRRTERVSPDPLPGALSEQGPTRPLVDRKTFVDLLVAGGRRSPSIPFGQMLQPFETGHLHHSEIAEPCEIVRTGASCGAP
jgi:hypothetical protein